MERQAVKLYIPCRLSGQPVPSECAIVPRPRRGRRVEGKGYVPSAQRPGRKAPCPICQKRIAVTLGGAYYDHGRFIGWEIAGIRDA